MKLAVLVDNPKRDLNGAVLIAHEAAKRGADAYLIPLYDQAYEIPLLRPDVVIVNYVRVNNLVLIADWVSSGIKICVLDTEGAPARLNQFAQAVRELPVDDLVDMYCCWGVVQKQLLIESNAISEEKVVATGCPRFDFAAEKFRGLSPDVDLPQDYILVNSQYGFLNPKFAPLEVEQAAKKSVGRYSDNELHHFYIDAKESFIGFLGVIEVIATCFPDQFFVIRPHPFESMEPYQNLNTFSNVAVIQEGSVLDYLKGCRFMIHVNCTSAIEAAFLGKPAIALTWLDFEGDNANWIKKASIEVKSCEELLNFLPADVNSRNCCPDYSGLEDIFGPIDGSAHRRVVDAIFGLGDSSVSKGEKQMRQTLKSWVRSILGYRACVQLANLCGGGRLIEYRKEKLFSHEDVSDLVKKLNKVLGSSVGCGAPPSVRCWDRWRSSGNVVSLHAVEKL